MNIHPQPTTPISRTLAPLLLLAFVLGACTLNPPHFIGEERTRQKSHTVKPPWTDWAIRFQEGHVFVTGLATRIDKREDARRAAEDDARNRLASSIETKIVADFQHLNRTTMEKTGGEKKKIQDSHEVKTQVNSTAQAILQDTQPVAEYHERYNLFVGGWRDHFDYWVLIKFPENLYRKHLATARAKLLKNK